MKSFPSSGGEKGIAAIVGVGPGLGLSIARKFAHEGYTVAILSRDLGRLSSLAEEIAIEGKRGQVFAIRIDCSDSRSVREAFEGVLSLGFVEVLVYNAHSSSSLSPARLVDIPVASFEKSIAVSSVGPFCCAQQVLPSMVERGRGTILFTGCSASLNGLPGFSELCCGKFALRGLSQCLSKELQPLGVHVAHIVLHTVVLPPRPVASTASSSMPSLSSRATRLVGEGDRAPLLDPDTVAQTYWQLHIQDKSAWTHEIDLFPPPPATTISSTATTATASTFRTATHNFFN